jgi:hypothetical protein
MKTRPPDCLATWVIISFGNDSYTTLTPILLDSRRIGYPSEGQLEEVMNHKQKLGYTLLGAGIMAVGITIGQVITPDIEAQSNGVFDEITCRSLEVVDENGNTGIMLDTGYGVRIFNKEGISAIRLTSIEGANAVIVSNPSGRPAIQLFADEDYREVNIFDKDDPLLGSGSIRFVVSEEGNSISIKKGKTAGETIYLMADEETGPFIFISDRTGKIKWSAP